MRGLYLHIPFCHSRCHYCNFISLSNPDPETRRRVLICLADEMDGAEARYGHLKFGTVYFGGGSPSVLSVGEMTGIMNGIRNRFEIAPDAEITCEWNPGDGDDEKLTLFQALGVNRISLGVQSFQDPLLARLGRRHTTHETILAIEKIRNAGIHNISLDLMLRLPGQTIRDFQESLDRAVELRASQVSLYDLEVHDGTVLGRANQENPLDLPKEEEYAAMYQAAIHSLARAGYEHYEISNFAKPDFASRHNLIYWRNQEYLGIGPGSFSYLNGIRYQFASGVERYLQKCESKNWRNDVQDELSEEEKETESFVTGLRLREGVRPEQFKRIYPVLEDRIRDLLRGGLLEKAGLRIWLTDRGRFLSESVFGFLLRR